jgi:two-component system, NarL family, sensor kinase
VKLYSSNRASAREWLRIASHEACDRLYWNVAKDLLFAARPSHQGRFVYEGINPAFEALLGITSQEIGELEIAECMGQDDARAVCEALQACVAEGTEVRIRHSLAFGGSRQTMETTVVPVSDPVADAVVRLIGCHRILRKGPFESTTDVMTDVQMSVSVASIQEDIQQRIASDLHDSTCQHLIAASLGLMRMRNCLHDPVSAGQLCDGIDSSIDEALREIRAFAYLLHPQNLSIDGLKATIEHYSDGFAARTLLRVTTRISPEVDRIPYEAQRSLLRVIQEALTNVFRHAKATEVRIVIDATDNHFRLLISDNGCGLPAGRAKHGTNAMSIGVGIPAMRARLEQLGGALDIRSNPAMRHSGTVLRAVFPHGLAASRRSRRKAATETRALRRNTMNEKH